MLLRILTMKVRADRLEDWMRYTSEIGFPGMLRQAGCLQIWRMRQDGAAPNEYQVITLWENAEALARFKASDAMRELSASAEGLTIPPHGERLYRSVPD
jgi:quinol monooxygenase YgiN